MTTAADDANRHRVLEGVLLRLARRAEVDAFVLRGGLLMRHWFRPDPRPADDVDLVALFPFDVDAAARQFRPVLEEPADDGVWYDPERTRVAGIRLDSDDPAVRVFATGVAGGTEFDFNVDITFGPYPRPAPVRFALPTLSGLSAELLTCRPEAVAGQKVKALRHRGMLGWRPKDLNDLRLLFRRAAMDPGELRDAVRAYLGDMGAPLDDARAIFGPDSWWGTKIAAARWRDFAREAPELKLPRDLSEVVAEVTDRLLPVLEGAR